MQYLYHASTVQNLKVIEPRKRFTPSESIKYCAIYASLDAKFSACHSFPWSSDENIDIVFDDKDINLSIPKKLYYRLNTPISIYTLNAKDFALCKEESSNLTYLTEIPQTVVKEKKYSSVEECLKHLKVNIETF